MIHTRLELLRGGWDYGEREGGEELTEGFVLSDHADWTALNSAVKATGAEQVFVTHGYSEVFAHWLSETGIEAKAVKTQFEGELAEIAESGIDESKTEAA